MSSYAQVSSTPPPSYEEAMGWAPHRSLSTRTLLPRNTSSLMICPLCHDEIETTTKVRRRTIAYVASGIVLFTTCGMGCWLIPCILDGFNEIHHSCPVCKANLGTVPQHDQSWPT
ncbi:cell death-inducing p53-target protein 1 [Drosophila yakuba]|uniref:LITAF domain-containing protein n=1 Tax=Drosophila yakuba TaxID=7245 RepID=B4P9N0_DROYA|nr:cell death-inducing p53-target protein 1 [Drosophila yakuba]EDW92338.1 uncharacterized protein Dyak_GE14296 [Drosophila yakuba]